MLSSFSEFKFFNSFRVPVEKADNLRFLVEKDDDIGNSQYIDDAVLVDVSVTGLGFKTAERLSIGTPLTISLQFKRNHLDLIGRVVRAFSDGIDDEDIIYGIEIDTDKKVNKFLESYILSFSSERLKDCLTQSALRESYTKASDGFEIFSLLLSLFKDITKFGDKEGFVESMLEEVIRIMNAQRASIFLINPENNELEAIAALGMNKEELKFDYRLGVAGAVFTTGSALNIDTDNDKSFYNNAFDNKFDFETTSIICHPIHNREDKIIGVIEVINKRNQDRFTVEDEKTMKVLALVFSAVFHSFAPLSEKSMIRRFSSPFDRKFALIGNTAHIKSLRNSIVKLKDVATPLLIQGEKGSGKELYAKIIHSEGQRGLSEFNTVNCNYPDEEILQESIWGEEGAFAKCQAGTVYLKNIHALSYKLQEKLFETLSRGRAEESKLSIDVRLIVSTTVNLNILVDKGEFYEPLYDYISPAFIFIEPLRRRSDDLEMLAEYFLKFECKKHGLLVKNISPRLLKKINSYDWPGNIKEFKKAIERAVLYHPKAHIINDIQFDDPAAPLIDTTIKQGTFGSIPHVTNFKITLKDRVALVEREMIMDEIKRNAGNKSKAATEMGISREALRKKLLFSDKILENLSNNQNETDKKEAA